MSVYERLRELGIVLPDPSPVAGDYIAYAATDRLLFLSGHIAKRNGQPWCGQLGGKLSLEEGAQAARGVAIDLLGTLHTATGDLNKVSRIVKLLVLVNSTSDFSEHHVVANGASRLFNEVFADRGQHARSAFGAVQIPRAERPPTLEFVRRFLIRACREFFRWTRHSH
jgi:enamine deaminase RidA (YjgF/YER057c/UK114 family)